MRRGSVIVVLLALVLAAVTAASVAAAAPRPPLTLAALRSPFPAGVLDTQADSGSARDRAAVRAAAFQALDDESRVFSVSASEARLPGPRLLGDLTSTAACHRRLALLGRTRSTLLAARMAQAFDWTARHDLGRHRHDDGLFVGGRFHVDAWQGVQARGDTARAVVMGETRGRAFDGRPKRDDWVQYKLLLRRSPTAAHGWRLVRTQAATAVD